jgi:AcrR family transcriptional regulator
MIETKDKILDAAEHLFGEQGYSETSLRHIIADAGVNLAAIHYHFGSKEDLLLQLVHRRAEPINLARLDALARFEAEAGNGPVAVEKILEAFLAPAAQAAALHPELLRLMGRMHVEGCMPVGIQHEFEPMINRFIAAMRRTLPDLTEQELLWRLRAGAGATAFTMLKAPADSEDLNRLVERLIVFLSGGLRAPLAAPQERVEVTR